MKQSKRDFVNVTDIVDDDSSEEEYEDDDMGEESHTSTTTAVTIGRLRDIAKAQPLSNSISIIFTDLKGPFRTVSATRYMHRVLLKAIQSFYAVTISLSRVTPFLICVICWRSS